jgi:hypothetical protein
MRSFRGFFFFFFCGRVVHGRLGCPARRDSTSHAADEKKEWGTWLRVEVRRPTFSNDGGAQAGRSRTAEEHGPEESGPVGRQFDGCSSSFVGQLSPIPQIRGADGGASSGFSGSCGEVELQNAVNCSGSKLPVSTRKGKEAVTPRSAVSHNHVDPLVPEMGKHDSMNKGGMQEGQHVDFITGEGVQTVSLLVGATSSTVHTSHAIFVESSGGMQTVPPLHKAVSPHVHILSVPHSENVQQGPPSYYVDAMDSTGGAATELPQ